MTTDPIADRRTSDMAYGAALGGAATLLLTSPLARSVAGTVLRLGSRVLVAGYLVKLVGDVAAARNGVLDLDQPAMKRARFRAAVAAARADGELSADERARLTAFAEELADGEAMRSEFLGDLDTDIRLEELTGAATSGVMARQLYRDALRAIDTESATKRPYLDRLTSALNIGSEEAARIEDRMRRRRAAA